MCCSVLLVPNEKSGGKKSFTVYISVFHGELALFKAELETWVWCTQVTQRVLPGNLQKLNVPADVLKASRKRQDRFQLFSFNVTLTFRFSAGSTVEKHSGWRSWQKLSSLKSSFHAALAISVPALRWSFTAHEYYREMRENRRWRCAQRKLNTIFSLSRTLSAALMIHLKQFFSVTLQWMWMWTADRIKPATSNRRSSSQTLVTNWTALLSPRLLRSCSPCLHLFFPLLPSFHSAICQLDQLDQLNQPSNRTEEEEESNEVSSTGRMEARGLRSLTLPFCLARFNIHPNFPPPLSPRVTFPRVMSGKPFTPSLFVVAQSDIHISQSFHFCCHELEMFL